MCSQQTLGQSGVTLNQLLVCFHRHSYFQQSQKKGSCQGVGKKSDSEVYLLKEKIRLLSEKNMKELSNQRISLDIKQILPQHCCCSLMKKIEFQHTLPSVADFPLCYLFPQRTPGSPVSSRVWYAMGRGWASSSSWALLSPTTATVATPSRESQP